VNACSALQVDEPMKTMTLPTEKAGSFMPKKKILFFSHAVTMAHVTRPLKWIEELDTDQYDVYLASHPKFKKFCSRENVTFIDLECIEDSKFLKIVQKAAPIYDAETYERHIADDLRVIDLVKPDLIIGDFRHSLSVSCRLRKIKYINLTNAYWSPDTQQKYPLPEAPVIRVLGEVLAPIAIGLFIPFLLRLNFYKMAFDLRKSFRRAGLSFNDYRRVITDGDLTLFCDSPGLVPLKNRLENEKYVGPVVWSMPVPLPEWWGRLDPNKKRVFLSLGSSGPADSLPLIVRSLAKLDVEVIVALAGRKVDIGTFPNVHVADYLPVEEVCKDIDLMICNGGSPMCYTALIYGVPSIGIVSNNDQLLNMSHIEHRGAGRMMRFWNLSEKKIIETAKEVLENSSYKLNSETIQEEFDTINVAAQLQDVLEEALGQSSHAKVQIV
jgi:UDP:flavonoid glycosyltransferase YjiC (YdhE family)